VAESAIRRSTVASGSGGSEPTGDAKNWRSYGQVDTSHAQKTLRSTNCAINVRLRNSA